ncbi:MAG: hypothetical protein MZW92_23715 [Comamonadaceae bacterium]|nr:hypothetical protein [Comamonadaceae bacterium]
MKNPATGGHQFLDKQWNRVHKQWEPYGQKNDLGDPVLDLPRHRLPARPSYDPKNAAAHEVGDDREEHRLRGLPRPGQPRTPAAATRSRHLQLRSNASPRPSRPRSAATATSALENYQLQDRAGQPVRVPAAPGARRDATRPAPTTGPRGIPTRCCWSASRPMTRSTRTTRTPT